MARLGFDAFAVAGHDRGGRVAYRMALDHPERCSGSRCSTSSRRARCGRGGRRRRAWLLALGVPGAPRAAAGAADRRRPDAFLTCTSRALGLGARTAPRCSTRTGAPWTTPAPSRRCARTTGRARPSTSSTTTPTAPRPRIACPVLVLWAATAACRASIPTCSTSGARGRPTSAAPGVDARHFLAEDARARPPTTSSRFLAWPPTRDHCLAPGRVDAPIFGGRYRSLFEDLPPLRADEDALHALGRPGGPCDLGDGRRRADRRRRRRGVAVLRAVRRPRHHRRPLAAGRIAPTRRGCATSAPRGPTSRASTAAARSARRTSTPRTIPPSCCSRRTGIDVPRNHEGIALIGDPRNDVHLFTSQMQVAFIALHNRLVDRLRDDGVAEADVFEEARRATTWHYQHVILREFLPGLIGAELTAELLERRPAAVPRRRGSLHPVRVRRRRLPLRPRPDPRPLPGQRALRPVPGVPGPDGLRPGRARAHGRLGAAVRRRGPPPAQRAKRIDARLPAPLIALPTQISGAAPGTDYASLATRDLQRGQAVGLRVRRGRRAPPRRAAR